MPDRETVRLIKAFEESFTKIMGNIQKTDFSNKEIGFTEEQKQAIEQIHSLHSQVSHIIATHPESESTLSLYQSSLEKANAAINQIQKIKEGKDIPSEEDMRIAWNTQYLTYFPAGIRNVLEQLYERVKTDALDAVMLQEAQAAQPPLPPKVTPPPPPETEPLPPLAVLPPLPFLEGEEEEKVSAPQQVTQHVESVINTNNYQRSEFEEALKDYQLIAKKLDEKPNALNESQKKNLRDAFEAFKGKFKEFGLDYQSYEHLLSPITSSDSKSVASGPKSKQAQIAYARIMTNTKIAKGESDSSFIDELKKVDMGIAWNPEKNKVIQSLSKKIEVAEMATKLRAAAHLAFARMDPAMFEKGKSDKYSSDIDNIVKDPMKVYGDTLSYWIQTEILASDNHEQTAQHWFNIMQQCIKTQDYFTATIISGSLQSNPVRKLVSSHFSETITKENERVFNKKNGEAYYAKLTDTMIPDPLRMSEDMKKFGDASEEVKRVQETINAKNMINILNNNPEEYRNLRKQELDQLRSNYNKKMESTEQKDKLDKLKKQIAEIDAELLSLDKKPLESEYLQQSNTRLLSKIDKNITEKTESDANSRLADRRSRLEEYSSIYQKQLDHYNTLRQKGGLKDATDPNLFIEFEKLTRSINPKINAIRKRIIKPGTEGGLDRMADNALLTELFTTAKLIKDKKYIKNKEGSILSEISQSSLDSKQQDIKATEPLGPPSIPPAAAEMQREAPLSAPVVEAKTIKEDLVVPPIPIQGVAQPKPPEEVAGSASIPPEPVVPLVVDEKSEIEAPEIPKIAEQGPSIEAEAAVLPPLPPLPSKTEVGELPPISSLPPLPSLPSQKELEQAEEEKEAKKKQAVAEKKEKEEEKKESQIVDNKIIESPSVKESFKTDISKEEIMSTVSLIQSSIDKMRKEMISESYAHQLLKKEDYVKENLQYSALYLDRLQRELDDIVSSVKNNNGRIHLNEFDDLENLAQQTTYKLEEEYSNTRIASMHDRAQLPDNLNDFKKVLDDKSIIPFPPLPKKIDDPRREREQNLHTAQHLLASFKSLMANEYIPDFIKSLIQENIRYLQENIRYLQETIQHSHSWSMRDAIEASYLFIERYQLDPSKRIQLYEQLNKAEPDLIEEKGKLGLFTEKEVDNSFWNTISKLFQGKTTTESKAPPILVRPSTQNISPASKIVGKLFKRNSTTSLINLLQKPFNQKAWCKQRGLHVKKEEEKNTYINKNSLAFTEERKNDQLIIHSAIIPPHITDDALEQHAYNQISLFVEQEGVNAALEISGTDQRLVKYLLKIALANDLNLINPPTVTLSEEEIRSVPDKYLLPSQKDAKIIIDYCEKSIKQAESSQSNDIRAMKTQSEHIDNDLTVCAQFMNPKQLHQTTIKEIQSTIEHLTNIKRTIDARIQDLQANEKQSMHSANDAALPQTMRHKVK